MATDGRWSAEASAAGTYSSWDPANEIGAMPPLGYFDPAGFTTNEPTFRKLRTAEIKHGRVAMMAALGAVVQHYVQIPGFESVLRKELLGHCFFVLSSFSFFSFLFFSSMPVFR